MQRPILTALVCALAFVACDEAGESAPSPAASATPQAQSAAAPDEPETAEKPAASAKVKGAAEPEEKKASGLPPIEQTRLPMKAWLESRKLHRQGLALYKKQSFAEADTKFLASITLDPGHIHPRYKLAASYALQEKKDEAFAILQELKDDGCLGCRQRLAALTGDPAYEEFEEDADLAKLREGLEYDIPTAKLVRAATHIGGWMTNPSRDRIPPTLKAARLVTTVVLCEGCPDTSKSMISLEVSDWASGFARQLFVGRGVVCEGTCCTYGAYDRQLGANTGGGRVLHQTCFETGEMLRVKRIEIY